MNLATMMQHVSIQPVLLPAPVTVDSLETDFLALVKFSDVFIGLQVFNLFLMFFF